MTTRHKQAAQAQGDYVPFGDEWRAEVMKMRKADIVELLRTVLIKAKATPPPHNP